MLILRRKKNESILIGDNIRITVVDCASDGVRIAIDAPRQVSILREELSRAEQENKDSIAPGFEAVSSLQSSLLTRLKPEPAAKLASAGKTGKPAKDQKGSEKSPGTVSGKPNTKNTGTDNK